ncbi:MAG: histidine--tRNA ligase [Deltaproteobacteria bacterium]|nr:histidine--tRNA ligase [Deltaproteobacteria bacterium]
MAKKQETRPASGTRDFLPDDVARRQRVTRVIEQVYRSYGFLPLETPSFERLETLLGKYGDEGDQLVFKILHRGQPLVDGIRNASTYLGTEGAIIRGRSGEIAPGAERLLADMGLRYDLTVPLARVVAEYQGKLPMPFKRYQIQPVWRADSPGKGRFREFWQCDVDVVGSSSEVVEMELCAAVSEVLERLGFAEFELLLNHRQLLRAIVAVSGISAELEGPAIVAIDKLDKVPADAVKRELLAKGVPETAADALLGLVLESPTLEALARQLDGSEIGKAAITSVGRVLELGAATRAAAHLKFEPSLARGLGYYTGNIFEIRVKDLAGSLGGGGRYDGLIGTFSGRDSPACGFSLGLERILVVMEDRKMFGDHVAPFDVALCAAKDQDLVRAVKLAAALREKGLSVDFAPGPTKPSKLRKAADDRNAPNAVWVEDGKIGLWQKASGAIETVEEPEILTRLGGG